MVQEKRKYSDSTLKELSYKILERLELHPAFLTAKRVALYHSMKDEVYTHDFIEKWSKHKEILLPAVVGDVLELRYYTTSESLSPGAYAIGESTGEPLTDYSLIDLIVVPGVAFNTSGWRLGRGKGYYDKLLAQVRAYKIGICFPFQVVEDIPTDGFDIRMDEVISCSYF